MADILHSLHMHATPADVWSALTQRGGPGSSWMRNGKVDSLEFRLGALVAKMKLAELEVGARVAWKCVDGPPDWIGTDISFDLLPNGDETVVRFRHRNWKETTDFMGHCSTQWACILFTLKSALETPEPDDLDIG
jgi:hypothetical protein